MTARNQPRQAATSRSTPVAAADFSARCAQLRIEQQQRADPQRELLALAAGLAQAQAHIDAKYFYDGQGGALFAAICALDEYYLTRTEAAIFQQHRDAIVAALPTQGQWIDLGCGDAGKSMDWLASTQARRFVGVDIATSSLLAAVASVAASYPQIECLGVVADFCRDLDLHQVLSERHDAAPIFFYPGSSIGNFPALRALALLRSIRTHLGHTGCLLIGVDLVKDIGVMEDAYADALGVTAAFNKNILRVVNGLLDSDFQPRYFDHVATFQRDPGRIEMRLRARRAQTVRLPQAERRFAAGESILTEYSHKYQIDEFAGLLSTAGFSVQQRWTDARQWFAVFLARP